MMISTAFRASSAAFQHTFETVAAQQFCRCGSPLVLATGAAQPATRRRWSSMISQSSSEGSSGRRRGIASSARWSQQLEQQGSSSTPRSPAMAPVVPVAVAQKSASASTPPSNAAKATASKPARREIKAAKAAIHLTPTAVSQLNGLLDSPTPKLIRIGVRNKGCAGMAYHLEYVDKPGKFDEVVKQDGVQVLIDSKALFSIVGSEMDWQEDKISSKFVFNNPNIKEQCGCGESFMT